MLTSRIRDLIEEKGYRRDFIAKKLEVTPQQISNWSSGRSYPTMDKAFKLSRLLGVTVEELYEYKEE